MTWQTLHQQALALAGWLQARGVKRGDRVLLYMQNCPQYVVAAFAVLRADAVIVPVHIELGLAPSAFGHAKKLDSMFLKNGLGRLGDVTLGILLVLGKEESVVSNSVANPQLVENIRVVAG